MTDPTHLSVSVIVPVGKDDDNWRLCASSLAQTNPSPQEIIVVADGILGNPWPRIAEMGWKVMNTPRAEGPARARNLGAHVAKGGILFFVDSDVTLPPNVIARVAEVFAGQPEVAAVFGSYDSQPAAANFLSQYKNLLHHYVHQTSKVEASTFWSGCGAVRKDIFLKLGGFAERYADPSTEDIEFGYRLRKAGYHIRLQKDLQVKHLKHWGMVSLLQSDFFHRALPWSEIILRNPEFFIDDLNLRLPSRISVIFSFGLIAGLAAAPFRIWGAGLATVNAIGLLALNFPLYRFFGQKRGLWFAVRTIPWHWLYYLYSGIAFALAILRHFLGFLSQTPIKTDAAWQSRRDENLGSD